MEKTYLGCELQHEQQGTHTFKMRDDFPKLGQGITFKLEEVLLHLDTGLSGLRILPAEARARAICDLNSRHHAELPVVLVQVSFSAELGDRPLGAR